MNEVQNESKKSEKFNLWWLDQCTDKRHYAGVAFYEEGYGEYRLKIDFLQGVIEGARPIYLRMLGVVDERILYRAEVVVKNNGKYAGRLPIGDGYSSKDTGGDVLVDLGPFERKLMLSMNTNL